MTKLLDPDPGERARWRKQALKAAHTLKEQFHKADPITIGFAFDDAIATLKLPLATVNELDATQLGEHIFSQVLLGIKAEGNA